MRERLDSGAFARNTRSLDGWLDGWKASTRAALRRGRHRIAPLFSFEYRRIDAEALFPFVHLFAMIGLFYAVVELSVFGFRDSITRGLVYLLVIGPSVLIGGLAAVRIGLSFILALIRIADNMEDLGDLPRWVKGLTPRRAPWTVAAPEPRENMRKVSRSGRR